MRPIHSIARISSHECIIEYYQLENCAICANSTYFSPSLPVCAVCGVAIQAIPCQSCTFLNPIGPDEASWEKCQICGNLLRKSEMIQVANDTQYLELQASAASSTAVGPVESSRRNMAGLSSIMQSLSMENESISNTLSAAFSDLDSLIANANEMVTLSRQISAKIASSTSDDRAKFGQDDLLQFGASIAALGIVGGPVLQSDHGSKKFSILLAQELSTVLQKYYDGKEFILGLADAYCILNRARGVCMLSQSLTIVQHWFPHRT